jgi:hypothetical protein
LIKQIFMNLFFIYAKKLLFSYLNFENIFFIMSMSVRKLKKLYTFVPEIQLYLINV